LKYGSPKLFILPVPIEQIEQLVWHGYGSMSDHLPEVGQLGQLGDIFWFQIARMMIY
jgi:hypothetical protein